MSDQSKRSPPKPPGTPGRGSRPPPPPAPSGPQGRGRGQVQPAPGSKPPPLGRGRASASGAPAGQPTSPRPGRAPPTSPRPGPGPAPISPHTGQAFQAGIQPTSPPQGGTGRAVGRGLLAPMPQQGEASGTSPGPSQGGRGVGRGILPPPTKREEAKLSEGMSTMTLRTGSGQMGAGRGAGRALRPVEYYNTRPEKLDSKEGASGSLVGLYANYFQVNCPPQWELFKYRVDIAPDTDEIRLRKQLVNQHRDQFKEHVYDGGHLIFSPAFLGNELTLTSQRREDGAIYKLTITPVGTVNHYEYGYTQFFNLVMKKAMQGMNLSQIRRDYFDSKAAIDFPRYHLELWPGYSTSIRHHDLGVLLCCDPSFKVLRTDTVLQQLHNLREQGRNQDEMKRALVGNIVITRYNNKTYRIDDIIFDESPSQSFRLKSGRQITYLEYYQEKYNTRIKDAKQPLLVSMPSLASRRAGLDQPVKLIPELSFMTGYSDEQKSNFTLMKDIGKYTRTDPANRVNVLNNFMKRIHQSDQSKQALQDFNMDFSKELVKIDARCLDSEKILWGDNNLYKYASSNADWGNKFRNFKLFLPVELAKWVVIYPKSAQNVVKRFVEAIQSTSRNMGFPIRDPRPMGLDSSKTAEYVQSVMNACKMKPDMVMVISPNSNRNDVYGTVKKICYVEIPTPNQVVTLPVISKEKGMMSVATKVAVQMCAKLGGIPWAIDIPLKGLMVVGIDVYHDTLNKKRSIGAFVASLNTKCTRYVSHVCIHETGQEFVDEISICMAKALRRYHDTNGSFPVQVFIYRDGVGDGNIPYLKETEVEKIREVFTSLNIAPKMTFIMVSKRVRSRFFRRPTPSSIDNPESGTVIDKVVTLPEKYDFFLVSQSVRQGTVNPTSYSVIIDESSLSPDQIQKLSYKLTHLYFNWPGTVRVPAPCQYAHKLAYLVGESIHQNPHEGLSDLLYYL